MHSYVYQKYWCSNKKNSHIHTNANLAKSIKQGQYFFVISQRQLLPTQHLTTTVIIKNWKFSKPGFHLALVTKHSFLSCVNAKMPHHIRIMSREPAQNECKEKISDNTLHCFNIDILSCCIGTYMQYQQRCTVLFRPDSYSHCSAIT